VDQTSNHVLTASVVISISLSHDVPNSPPQYTAHSDQSICHASPTVTSTDHSPKLRHRSSDLTDYFADFPDFELNPEKDAELLALLDGKHEESKTKPSKSGHSTFPSTVTDSNMPSVKNNVYPITDIDVANVSPKVSALPATLKSDSNGFILPRFVIEMVAKTNAPLFAEHEIIHCLQEKPGYKQKDWEYVLEHCGFSAKDILVLIPIMNSFMDDDGPVSPI
jgi:hypothetical protein